MTLLQQVLQYVTYIKTPWTALQEQIVSSTGSGNMSSLYLSVRRLAQYAQVAFISSSTVFGGAPASCPNAQLSCQNTTAVADTCCFNAPVHFPAHRPSALY